MADQTGTIQNYEWYEGLAGAYVLGTLSIEERADFERYLASSPQLQAEVASLTPGARALALAAEERTPSAELRAKLFAAINAEPNTAGQTAPAPAPISLPEVRAARGWVVNPLYAKIAAALALVLIGSLLAWNFSLRNDNEDAQPQVLAELTAFDPNADTGAGGEVTYLPEQGVIQLKMTDLPALPEDEVYQLWFITDNGSAPVPSVVFRPDESNDATIAVQGDPATFDILAITQEPGPVGGGSPTNAPFLAASV
jgi:anti-sigma-K factor RskA